MAKFMVGQKVCVLVDDGLGFPVGTYGVVTFTHWEQETPTMEGACACYEVEFSGTVAENANYNCGNYYDTELAPAEGVQ